MRYRKKPVVIEATQYHGNSSDVGRINHWMETGELHANGINTNDYRSMVIPTLEGDMTAQPGDWIIKGVKGEFYPCKPDIFEATYEREEQ